MVVDPGGGAATVGADALSAEPDARSVDGGVYERVPPEQPAGRSARAQQTAATGGRWEVWRATPGLLSRHLLHRYSEPDTAEGTRIGHLRGGS